MDPIMELATRQKLRVYEDVCQGPFGRYKDRLNGTLAHAAAFSFDPEKTMPSDRGGCVVTNDDKLADRIRMVSIMRGVKVMKPGFGRVHDVAGNAYYMTGCTAAICLAQLEIIHEHVARRDKMIRLLSKLIGEIPGVAPLPIPDYATVYSPWMFSMSLDLGQFRCTADEFGTQLAAAGIPDASTARYYYPPLGSAFLERNAAGEEVPLLHAAGLARVSLRRRHLPSRVEVPSELDPLVHVLREVYRAALRAGCPHCPRGGGEES